MWVQIPLAAQNFNIMNIGKPFKSIASYNNAMSKNIDDKLFFTDFLPKSPMLIVDFGCADGTLISKMYELYNEGNNSTLIRYIGFDISEEMINLAKTKFDYCTNQVLFTSNWNEVKEQLVSYTGYKVLILSSVIHEVYSYGTEESVRVFWDRVIHSGFHYICVRDMMYSEDMDRPANSSKADSLFRTPKYCKAYDDFINVWGNAFNNKNLIHFLLKYRWQINWQRELNENYFPIELNTFLSKFESMYNQTYLERFRVPFLEECWKKDFDITINDYTHIKAIFERKK